MNPLRAYFSLVRWDWAREWKRKETLIAMAMMSLITLFIFSVAMPPVQEVLEDTRGGILWVTFVLAGTVGIDRAFRGDGDGRLLTGLLLSPVGRGTVYYARITSTMLGVVLMEAMTLGLFMLLFDQSLEWEGLLVVVGVTLAATLGFVAVGVILSAMTWSLRGGDAILRILLFPLLIPLLSAAVHATNEAFAGRPIGFQPVAVIGAFDLVFIGAGQLLFEFVVDGTETGT